MSQFVFAVSAGTVVLYAVGILVVVLVVRTVRVIPQARAGIVERFGRYNRTLEPGLNFVLPFMERLLPKIDLREQVVSFQPQAVITKDNVNVAIDTVLYFTVTDPKAVTYEVAEPLQAIEQLTVTTLRNVVGGLDLEQALTSREHVNSQLRTVLDEATGKWGIRVNRVEIKAIDPPPSIQEAMEKQMRAERDKRATILIAEGERESAILQAEGNRQSAILSAEGEKQATVLEAEGEKEAVRLVAEGEAEAIGKVFQAIHEGKPDAELLAYQYLQQLPKIADGEASKMWIIPSEALEALRSLRSGFESSGRGENRS
jgi:regulator of protease activity HflC (stomatin/prohibitin superfamily)